MKPYLAGLFLLGILTFSVGTARADLITDGGFDADLPYSSTGSPTPSSGAWTFTGSQGDAAGVSRDAPPLSARSSPNFYAFGNAIPDTVSQTVATSPGVKYTLTYWVALDAATGSGPAEFFASFGPGSTLGPVVPGSDLIVSAAGSPIPQGGSYTKFTFTVTATSTTSTIGFTGRNGPSWWALDDASLLAPVPEPSSMALCGLGALGFILPAGWKWRRQKKAAATIPAPAA